MLSFLYIFIVIPFIPVFVPNKKSRYTDFLRISALWRSCLHSHYIVALCWCQYSEK
nr:MAG TPA: hypothetical protein [Caudoviricetes sp.]